MLLTLCLGLMLPLHPLAAMAQSDQQADYEARMKELQQTIQQLQKELEKTRGSRDQLERQLEESESDIGELLKKIRRIESDLKEQNQDLQSLKRRRDTLNQSRARQQAAVAEQVRAAYQLGRQSQIKLLLNQEEPQRVSRLLRYYDYWLEARTDKIKRYLETLAELDRVEPEILRTAAALEQSREALASRHQQLKARQEDRRQTLAALNQRIRSTDQELNQLREDRERLQILLDEMVAAVADLEIPGGDVPFSQRKGRLTRPAEGGIRYRFGSTQADGQLKRNGIVIGAAAGSPVLAVHHGRVVFSDYFRGHGLLLIVDHGEGYMSLYAHNQTLYKETGEWVTAGETIARVGSSGGQPQAGLYFEIRHRGKPTNPASWLAQA